MTDMTSHAKPPARRDHLWVLVIIAACALLEVWASWVMIGSTSGFPKIGGKHGLPTDWTLAVTTEAYWGYALYAWLAAAPGPRSRRFAMWSAAAVFLLSLTGQGSAHLVRPGTTPPAALVVFVTALPVIVLALIAVLVHLRQADREEAAEAERVKAEAEHQAEIERAEADERVALRAALERAEAEREAVRAELAETALRAEDADAARAEADAERFAREAADAERDAIRTELETAVARADAATAKAERLERKLGGPKRRSTGGTRTRRTAPSTARADDDSTAPGTAPEDDIDLEAKALKLLATDLTMSGAELARHLRVTEGYGRRLRRRLTQQDPPSGGEQDRPREADSTAPEDRPAGPSQDRGERS
jgi:hypothetical protein